MPPHSLIQMGLIQIKMSNECMDEHSVVIGVHTDGPTDCREMYSSPCSLMHVHVHSTQRPACPISSSYV